MDGTTGNDNTTNRTMLTRSLNRLLLIPQEQQAVVIQLVEKGRRRGLNSKNDYRQYQSAG